MSVEIDTKQPLRIDLPEANDLYHRFYEQVTEHPYRTLAVAAGVGFVLGGGLLNRATGKLVATGLRMGMAAVVAPLAAQIVDQMRGGGHSQTKH